MFRAHRAIVLVVLLGLLSAPATALAREADPDTTQTTDVADEMADSVIDPSADVVSHQSKDPDPGPLTDPGSDRSTDRVSDRQTDRVFDRPHDGVSDRPTDRVSDRVGDHRPIDRCRAVTDNPRRCLNDRPQHDLNIRHLIWRLIKAHEWEKLFLLLHRLGLI